MTSLSSRVLQGHTYGPFQERLPASCRDVCGQLRIIKGIPTEPGACFSSRAVDRDSLSGLRPDDFFEPPTRTPNGNAPGVDPHALWRGEGRLITALYPIMHELVFLVPCVTALWISAGLTEETSLRPFPVIFYEMKNLFGPVSIKINPLPVWSPFYLRHEKAVIAEPSGEGSTKEITS